MDDQHLKAALDELLPPIDTNVDAGDLLRVPDETLEKVSELLRDHKNDEGSKRPRTYTLLHLIRHTQHNSSFGGNTDNFLPYMDWTLPAGFRDHPDAPRWFIEYQCLVLPTGIQPFEPREKPHMELQRDEDSHLDPGEPLGQGSYGSVDGVKGKFSKKSFARKRFAKGKSWRHRARLASYEKELQALRRVQHHHLVQFIGSYETPRCIALMIRPLADCDLKHWIETGPEKDFVRQCFGCLAVGLGYMHRESIRHKDIKPSNILVHKNTVYLTDLGSALDWRDLDASTTSGSAFCGTRKYAAPEVLKNEVSIVHLTQTYLRLTLGS